MDLRIALAAVAETTRDGATIGAIEARLGRRSHAVLAALACLPFLTPIPTPGLSVPFGLLISGIGLWQACGVERPRLPRWIAARRIPSGFFARLIDLAGRILGWIQHGTRRRATWLVSAPFLRLAGLAIALDGLLLALPLPIPFTNAIAAWPALFLLLAGLRRDGVMLLTGLALTLLTAAAFTGLAIAAWLGVAWATRLWGG